MLHIGYHESTSNGLEGLGIEALEVGADTFAFFTRNPRGGKAKDIDPSDAEKLNALRKEHNFAPPVAHAPYTMNPCSADEGLRQYALEMMIDDFLRLEYTPGSLYNFHPGSHTGQGAETGIDLTSSMISNAIKEAEKKIGKAPSTTLLIETMAGKGSEIGRTFEEVRAIIDKAEEKFGSSLKGRLGVCLDTCHIWDGGYDIVNDLDGVVTQFDKIIGLDRLKAIHLNDSMNDLGAHKDRHEKIGEGHIGFEALKRVTVHSALKDLPFILETPNDQAGYKKEIEMLR
ncbi:deoxyribonuclease IV [Treponema sp.]|uniref:deoxyribonuclease IV n=1 Tax=Treponema sp. TaxID=166 RepID=UPI00298DAA54|nr:deoxyribonuclease IV [Treponema sp.]